MLIKIKDNLPTKLHELLSVSLTDLAKKSDDPDYVIDMNSYHLPQTISVKDDSLETKEVCNVCMAGAMLGRCGLKKNHGRENELLIQLLPESLSHKLRAIDHIRRGHLESAFSELDIAHPLMLACSFNAPAYNLDTELFFEFMWKLQAVLQSLDV